MTTPESSPVKKSFTTELTPEAKAKKICELFKIEPGVRHWEFKAPKTGERWGWYNTKGAAEADFSRNFQGEKSTVYPVPEYPALTTDFLLRVARENGIDHSISWRGDRYGVYLRENTNAHGYCGDRPDIESQAESPDPTEALYLALLRFRGEEK